MLMEGGEVTRPVLTSKFRPDLATEVIDPIKALLHTFCRLQLLAQLGQKCVAARSGAAAVLTSYLRTYLHKTRRGPSCFIACLDSIYKQILVMRSRGGP